MKDNFTTDFECRICGNKEKNKKFVVREMMFGIRDEFDYYECSSCKCLQINKIPENISKYYPKDYYSFNTKEEKYNSFIFRILRLLVGIVFIKTKFWNNGGVILKKAGLPFLEIIKQTKINFNSKILDVGSGDGGKLNLLASAGFKNLTGLDPFITRDISNPKFKIYKKNLSDLDEKFDMIMLNHSFEHMDQPEQVLNQINKILNPNSIALIRIPIADSYSWKKYGTNWFNLDAPRHFYLHTLKSMKILVEKTNFEIENIIYDSDASQFWASEQYTQDIPLHDKRSYHKNKNLMFTNNQIENFKNHAKLLNSKKDGDKACFYLRKKLINS